MGLIEKINKSIIGQFIFSPRNHSLQFLSYIPLRYPKMIFYVIFSIIFSMVYGSKSLCELCECDFGRKSVVCTDGIDWERGEEGGPVN